MNEIQQARNALANWRDEATAGQWIVDLDRGENFDADDYPEVYGEGNADSVVLPGGTVAGHDIRLIVGTAGNSDLLDAVDWFLLFYEALAETAEETGEPHPKGIDMAAQRIAAAITSADKRMAS